MRISDWSADVCSSDLLESTGWTARGKRCAKRNQQGSEPVDFIAIFSIFVLACFVGYFVVWSVNPALHTPLMSVTNAIASVINVGALIASAAAGSDPSRWLGHAAVVMARIEILGGMEVAERLVGRDMKQGGWVG